jgi:hypothetical protein
MRPILLALALLCALAAPSFASAEVQGAPPAPSVEAIAPPPGAGDAIPPPPPDAVPPPPAVLPPPPPLAPPQRDRQLGILVGLGMVVADGTSASQVNGYGSGLYASAEYAFRASSWFSPRLYGGLLYAPTVGSSCEPEVSPCDVSGRYVFAGAKARLTAPIPWVAPFAELGLGASVGRFSSRYGTVVDRSATGLTYHVPVAVGLAVGPHHGLELSFQYLVHPALLQTGGGTAIGFRF